MNWNSQEWYVAGNVIYFGKVISSTYKLIYLTLVHFGIWTFIIDSSRAGNVVN